MAQKKAMKAQVSVYLPNDLHAEVTREAERLERSRGWMLRHAWRLARKQIREAGRGELDDL